jgi:hypothetical protein
VPVLLPPEPTVGYVESKGAMVFASPNEEEDVAGVTF